MKWLERKVHMSAYWFATLSSGPVLKVTHFLMSDKFVVNLQKQSCTCYFWDLVGIPCRRVVCSIKYIDGVVETYVHKYYKIDLYQMCYE